MNIWARGPLVAGGGCCCCCWCALLLRVIFIAIAFKSPDPPNPRLRVAGVAAGVPAAAAVSPLHPEHLQRGKWMTKPEEYFQELSGASAKADCSCSCRLQQWT